MGQKVTPRSDSGVSKTTEVGDWYRDQPIFFLINCAHNLHTTKCTRFKSKIRRILRNVYSPMWPPFHRELPFQNYHFKLFLFTVWIWNESFENWFWNKFKAGHLEGFPLSLSDLLSGLEWEPNLPRFMPRDGRETTLLGFTQTAPVHVWTQRSAPGLTPRLCRRPDPMI